MGRLVARVSRQVSAGFHCPGCDAGARRDGEAAGQPRVGEQVELGQGCGDLVGPGPVAGEAEDPPTAGGDELSGRGEQAESQAEVTPEGVRQLISRGASVLRHPARAFTMREYLDTDRQTLLIDEGLRALLRE